MSDVSHGLTAISDPAALHLTIARVLVDTQPGEREASSEQLSRLAEHVAAAVSRAGGLGVLGCVRFNDADELDRTLTEDVVDVIAVAGVEAARGEMK